MSTLRTFDQLKAFLSEPSTLLNDIQTTAAIRLLIMEIERLKHAQSPWGGWPGPPPRQQR